MNLLLLLIRSPVLAILLKWTALLTLGWSVHWLLHRGHARWRLILWRSILCFGLTLPVLHFFPIPVLRISIRDVTDSNPAVPQLLSSGTTGSAIQPVQLIPHSLEKPTETATTIKSLNPSPSRPFAKSVSGKNVLLIIWAWGCAWGTIRLIRINIHLFRLRKEAGVAEPALQELAREIQARFNVRRTPRIQVSDSVQSPFVFGLLEPTIMLPKILAQNLSPSEATALLSHEIAHLRRHDLIWCVAWRWMNVIYWFHPLVWKVPAAHNLACEQEADRIASGKLEDRGFYPQLLARLALRVLALPDMETRLALNGTSQIAQRLNHLKQGKAGVWKWRHSAAGLGLVGILFLTAAGCDFSKAKAPDSKSSVTSEFKKVLVVVQDEDGKPIEGATIKPFGFRVQGMRRVDAHGWNTNQFGPVITVTTDREGKAWLKYPVVAIPEEKLLTGELTFTVSHPDYCPDVSQGFPVDGTGEPFRLTRGIPLEVSGYYGQDHQSVTELIPNLSQEGIKPEDWQKKENGVYAYHQLSAGGHLIQLMGRLPSGEIGYSDTLEFTAEKGKPCHFEMEMKPGIRIEGRLDDKVPRPVKNGRVLIDVRPPQFPAYLIPEDVGDLWKKYGDTRFWRSYRPIAEDGTFVFESVPPGEVDVIVHGDSFVSKSIGQVQNRIHGKLVNGPVIGIPQPFPLTAPLTKIEVVTEPTATLELTARTKWGKPIEGATVYLNPNVIRMNGIFGWMRQSSEEPLRILPPLPELPYSGKTDQNGKVVIRNIPAVARGLEIWHPQFVAQLNEPHGLPNRRIHLALTPGMTNIIEVTLQPAGKDFIGIAK